MNHTVDGMQARLDELLVLLREFEDAMLVTRSRDGRLTSRPMAIADCTESARLWFVSHIDSTAIQDVTEAPEVCVCLQDGKRFLSISGTVRVTRDAARIRELWSEKQRVWFEKGQADPTLVLLEIVPIYAEFWNRAGLAGVKFWFAELAAWIGGETLKADEGQHGQVSFDSTV